MKNRSLRRTIQMGVVVLFAFVVATGGLLAQGVQAPQPGVPEIYTIQGEFVRVAYNSEGYVSLGYRVANLAVGQEWMLLDLGLTLLDGGSKNFTLKRDGITVSTPDGKTIPMATNKEYRGGGVEVSSVDMQAKVARDSINYFPPAASRACRIGFFAELASSAMPFDQVDLSRQRACLGRIYFKVPGGIQHGQHFLNVQFEKSKVRAPFRILTKEEEKGFKKNWKDIKKEVDKAFKEAAKKN
jgi:hypothetical protein